jgi:Transposase DDE domain
MPTEAEASVPTEDWLIAVYVAVDTWWQRAGRRLVPARPGPAPACSDQELVALAVAREVLERRSERAWRAEVQTEWGHLFPHLPAQSEWNRRTRWLWGACEALRAWWTAPFPVAAAGWEAVDTTLLGIKHPSRVRGVTSCVWAGPADELVPGFGFCAALATWRYGFRLGLRTGLTDGLIRAWALVPAAVDERRVADGLLAGEAAVQVLTDRGFASAAWARRWAAEQQVTLLTAPDHRERRTPTRPAVVRAFVAAFRNRIETTTGRLKDRFHLEAHRARSFWGLLARVAAKLAAHTFTKLWPLELIPI